MPTYRTITTHAVLNKSEHLITNRFVETFQPNRVNMCDVINYIFVKSNNKILCSNIQWLFKLEQKKIKKRIWQKTVFLLYQKKKQVKFALLLTVDSLEDMIKKLESILAHILTQRLLLPPKGCLGFKRHSIRFWCTDDIILKWLNYLFYM